MLSLGRWLSLPDTPNQVFEISKDFFGVNVAPGDDPAVDDYLIARLRELGVSQVRMDFAYSSKGGPAQRLLDTLLEKQFEVLLDVFPDRAEAKILYKNTAAQQRWGSFLTDMFTRYGETVACFEIGATPNRGKWSGFSSRSFLAAWTIADKVAENYPVKLAGPNVSDFEPLFNATYLSLLQRLGRVPQVHTDNLFMERVIEPEAYDHRVFGRLASNRLKLNLIKKARILHLIGRDRGCEQTWCTYTCWTRKRLARRAAWPEDKAADYLLRYLTLAAASGALQRVYWGPLICARDGLIRTHSNNYPSIDQVSFYQRVEGEVEDFTTTPAFYTLKYCLSRFSGARALQSLHAVDGVSIFSFQGANGERFVLCWCRDGQSWTLNRFFSNQDMDEARFLNSQGQPIPRPLVISEHPIFIETEAIPTTVEGDSLSRDKPPALINLSSPAHQSLAYTDPQWRGAYMLRRDHQSEDLNKATTLYPDAIVKLEESAVLRDTRNRVWNVPDPRGRSDFVTVKLNRTRGFKRISYRFRPSKGRRHWNNACEMLRRGVSTPLPVAFHERPGASGVKDSWYLCEFIADAFSAKDVYAALRQGESHYKGLDKSAWFTLISAFVCNMHNRQIVHKDLSAGNLLLRQNAEGVVEPLLIDIGRAWLGNGSGLKQRHRIVDLIRIAYKLNWVDRAEFIAAYEIHLGQSLSSFWRVAFHFYDSKQALKKRLKGKYKKKYRS